MLAKIKAWIDKHAMLAEGDKIVVACSGGPDSLALLHIFNEFSANYNITIFAAHVDHMFRGTESAEEADFVADFCQKHCIPCFSTTIDVPKYIIETGLSEEEAARVVRYGYLRSISSKLGGAKIATGHHRDDQAETVLINILRGAGSTGIRGIQPVNGDIIRPLLSVSRTEITEYCKVHHLEPRFDSSNLKMNYLRNRIRMTLLPELESQYNVAIKESLCRTATIIGDEHDFIHNSAQNIWDQVVTQQEGKLFINGKKMENVHIAVQREIFRLAIEKKQGCLTGISFHHVETLLEVLANGRVGALVQLPGELVACKTYDGLFLGENDCMLPPKVDYLGQELPVPGTTDIAALGIKIHTELTNKRDITSHSNSAVFDWLTLTPPLFVRLRHEGDKFRPLGFHGSKKLKDFFIDEKVPQRLRDCTPIICDHQGIIWVGGYRQAESGKVMDQTTCFLRITLYPGNQIFVNDSEQENLGDSLS